MKYISIVSITFLLTITMLFAQENNTVGQDKKKYENNVFNKEFGETEDTVDLDRKLYDRIPEELPDWVFNPVILGNPARIVAFSDPNMLREEAYQQATLRAKAIYAMLVQSKLSTITDDYTNLKESGKYSLYATKFQDFTLAKAVLVYNDSNVNIADTFYTKYNEAIVALEFNIEKIDSCKKDTLTVRGEHLEVFIEKNFQREKVEFYNLSIRDKQFKNDSIDLTAQYNYKVVNRGYDISSFLGDQLIEFKERTYMYRTNLDFKADSTINDLNTFRLNRGLWNGYITGILSNVSVLSKKLASQVKNSNDYYTLKSEGLIRTMAKNKVSFGLNDFKMIENQFYIDLNGIIVQ